MLAFPSNKPMKSIQSLFIPKDGLAGHKLAIHLTFFFSINKQISTLCLWHKTAFPLSYICKTNQFYKSFGTLTNPKWIGEKAKVFFTISRVKVYWLYKIGSFLYYCAALCHIGNVININNPWDAEQILVRSNSRDVRFDLVNQ